MFSFFKRKKIQKQTYPMKAASTSGSVGVRKSLNSNFTESRVYDDSSDILSAVVTAQIVNDIMTPDPVYVSTDSGYSSSSSDYGSSSSDYSGGGGDFGGGGSSGDW